MSTPNLAQLNQALIIAEKIESLKSELASIVGGSSTTTASAPVKTKSGMSAAGRGRIAAAQKARWAKVKGTAVSKTAPVKKSTLSPAHKAKLKAAAKARWDRIRAGQEQSPFKK